MKYETLPAVSASACSTASRSGWPLGSRPSVSTVNDNTTGTPVAAAARAIPTASSVYVIVIALTRSAPLAANVPTWREW
jgi:hypothetical protein